MIEEKAIEDYIERAHYNAEKHGWHNEKLSKMHYVMMIITEIAEMVEADRRGHHPDMKGFQEAKKYQEFFYAFDAYIKDSVEDEMADICIRIFDMAGDFYNPWDFTKEMVQPSDIEIGGKSIDEFVKTAKFTEIAMNMVICLAKTDKPVIQLIASAFSMLQGMAQAMGINLEWHIRNKMRYNEERPYQHGGKVY